MYANFSTPFTSRALVENTMPSSRYMSSMVRLGIITCYDKISNFTYIACFIISGLLFHSTT